MKPARDRTVTQFSERVAIETAEHVDLELELAGLGSRTAAAIVDVLVLGVLYVVLGVVGSAAEGGLELRGWIVAANIALGFAFTWGYFLLFEALNAGRTPGKLALGIRVVLETGHPVTFAASAIRNILR